MEKEKTERLKNERFGMTEENIKKERGLPTDDGGSGTVTGGGEINNENVNTPAVENKAVPNSDAEKNGSEEENKTE